MSVAGEMTRQRIIAAIEDSVAKRGYPPTVREICAAVGLSSTDSVQEQLGKLEKQGRIRREPGKVRTLVVV
jgi:repressor LexA